MERRRTWLAWICVGIGCSSAQPIAAPCDGASSADGGCGRPIDCGELAVADASGACVPVGVSTCDDGFRADGRAGCDPILPTEPCSFGTIAVPGETECAPVGVCGAGPYPDVSAGTPTLYVDAAYSGGSSDGSKTRPFTTLGAATSAASSTTVVAIAAGTYRENLDLTRPVQLRGVCPSKVTVRGASSATAQTLRLAARIELSGVAVTGPTAGLTLVGAKDIRLENVWVHDTGGRGIDIEAPRGKTTEVTLTHVLVERARAIGVFVASATVTMYGSVVRDTLSQSGPPICTGPGVQVQGWYQGTDANPNHGRIEIHRSVLERNASCGVQVVSGELVLESTVIRDTKEADPHRGFAVFATADGVIPDPPDVTIRGSVFERNRTVGFFLWGGKGTVERTVVRDTQPSPKDGWGFAMLATRDTVRDLPADLTVVGSLVAESRRSGLVAAGSRLTIRGSLIRDTFADDAAAFGDGVFVTTDGNDVSRLVRSSLTMESTLVLRSARAGVFAFGSSASLTGTRLACSALDLVLQKSTRMVADKSVIESLSDLADGGGNVCGCGVETTSCQASSVKLTPIALSGP